MAVGEGKEVIAVEAVGGNELTPRRAGVTDPAQPIPGPSRATHDDLGLDLIGHRKHETAAHRRARSRGRGRSILRRSTWPGPEHPADAALMELGPEVRTVFVADDLRPVAPGREIHEVLQAVEDRNGAKGILCYGKASS